MQTTETAAAASAAPHDAAAGSAKPAEWITMTEAAARLGKHKSTVSRQVSTLGVAVNAARQIDWNDYLAKSGDLQAQMARTGALAESFEAGAAAPGAAMPGPLGAAVAANLGQPTRRGGLTSASTAVKTLQAQKLKLELDEKQGKIAQRSEIREHGTTAARVFRDEVLGLPARISHELAGLTDAAEINARLTAELTAMLTVLVAQLERLGSEQPLA